MVLSRGLQSSAEDGPDSPEGDCLDTTVAITERATDETTDESTDVVDCALEADQI